MLIESRPVGDRGTIFQFDDENLIYLIDGKEHLFLCDTHEGPSSIALVRNYVKETGLEEKELIAFNSHSDHDHIWGNCAFDGKNIIGTRECLKRMRERGDSDLELRGRYLDEDVKIVLPNVVFGDSLAFENDGVEFVHAPGHTICSAICFDRVDSVVYCGDLVEAPIPVVLYEDLDVFVKSLKFIKGLKAKTIICSHSGIVDEELIDSNIAYLKSLAGDVEVKLEEAAVNRHDFNRKNLVLLKYEKLARLKLGNSFDFKAYKKGFWETMDVRYEDLDREYRHILRLDLDDIEVGLAAYVDSL